MTVNSTGATLFSAAVGGTTALSSLTTDAGGTVTLQNVTTSGVQSYGENATLNGTAYTTTNANVSVGGTTTLTNNVTVSAGSGNVTFTGTVAATTSGATKYFYGGATGTSASNQSNFWIGDIGDLFIWTRTLTSSELFAAEDYLMNYWAV